MDSRAHLLQRIDGSLEAVRSLQPQIDTIAALADRIMVLFNSGGTLYTAGNGGSAAEAMHLAEELIGRYRGNRPAQRAICLNADPTALTCIANDFGYESVFSRQCEALLMPCDVLLVLSTSGRSRNIIKALETARTKNATTIGLLGGNGGSCAALCDLAVIIPGTDSANIQEAHQVVIHLLCEAIEMAGAS